MGETVICHLTTWWCSEMQTLYWKKKSAHVRVKQKTMIDYVSIRVDKEEIKKKFEDFQKLESDLIDKLGLEIKV